MAHNILVSTLFPKPLISSSQSIERHSLPLPRREEPTFSTFQSRIVNIFSSAACLFDESLVGRINADAPLVVKPLQSFSELKSQTVSTIERTFPKTLPLGRKVTEFSLAKYSGLNVETSRLELSKLQSFLLCSSKPLSNDHISFVLWLFAVLLRPITPGQRRLEYVNLVPLLLQLMRRRDVTPHLYSLAAYVAYAIFPLSLPHHVCARLPHSNEQVNYTASR